MAISPLARWPSREGDGDGSLARLSMQTLHGRSLYYAKNICFRHFKGTLFQSKTPFFGFCTDFVLGPRKHKEKPKYENVKEAGEK